MYSHLNPREHEYLSDSTFNFMQTTPEEAFSTKKKEYKNFKQHFLDFWDKIVREAQDNETLVNDDPFEQIISFIEKFSQCAPSRLRPLLV